MLTAILIILISSFAFERYLEWLNTKNWSDTLPEALEGLYNEEEYKKAQQYDRAKQKVSKIGSAFSLVLMIVFLISGSFALLDTWTHHQTTDLMFQALLFFGILALLSDILQMPFEIYNTFVVEEHFGFNRSTIGIFFRDKIKGYVLAILLGGSMLSLFVLFYQVAGNNFWWIAWVCISGFSILISMFYASWILPMFNKLSPLPDGELKTRLNDYCKKVQFPVSELFVMDGSKRSSKANAFFSGIGPKKKIVLFDTLIEKHTTDELLAVMAHEVGHYKKKHTQLTLLVSVLQTGLMLYLFSRLIGNVGLASALGAKEPSLPLGMVAFAMLYTPVSLALGVLMNSLSRKHEFEADAYAATTFGALPLASALKKLSVDNLSNLLPHRFYVFVYYSHPTLLQRLKKLKTY
ncbi:M48 family metallopeptidase [soil metagenome]